METYEERKKRYSYWLGSGFDESTIMEFEKSEEGKAFLSRHAGSGDWTAFRNDFEPSLAAYSKISASRKSARKDYVDGLSEKPGREATILTPRTPGDIASTILGGKTSSRLSILG